MDAGNKPQAIRQLSKIPQLNTKRTAVPSRCSGNSTAPDLCHGGHIVDRSDSHERLISIIRMRRNEYEHNWDEPNRLQKGPPRFKPRICRSLYLLAIRKQISKAAKGLIRCSGGRMESLIGLNCSAVECTSLSPSALIGRTCWLQAMTAN